MAASTPYAQLVGTLTLYLAPYGTAEPDVASTPSGSWNAFGCTEGDQTITGASPLTYFYDNCHQGPVKATRPQEDITMGLRLVDLTLENIAKVMRSAGVGAVIATATTKKLALRKGPTPAEWAMVLRGVAESPYGNFPGQYYIPRGVFEGDFARVRSKTARDAIDCMFHVLEDDAQLEDDRLGWQTAALV